MILADGGMEYHKSAADQTDEFLDIDLSLEMKAKPSSRNREYELLLMAILADGKVEPLERALLAEYVDEHPESKEQHAAILEEAGWTDADYLKGSKEATSEASPNSSEVTKSNWQTLRTGFRFTTQVPVAHRDDSPPVNLDQTLEEANERFLSTFVEDLVEAVGSAQHEVLAAKVLVTPTVSASISGSFDIGQ